MKREMDNLRSSVNIADIVDYNSGHIVAVGDMTSNSVIKAVYKNGGAKYRFVNLFLVFVLLWMMVASKYIN